MKKLFSIVLLFSRDRPFVHECSTNFRAHFLPIFEWSFIKTVRNCERICEAVPLGENSSFVLICNF